MSYLQCNKSHIYFEELGSGRDSVVFLHGTAGNHSHFSSQLEFFARSHKVVSIDLRGHGLSECLNDSFRIEDFSDDVLSLIRQLNLSQPTLVGHSLGGLIALDVASKNPSCLQKVVMLDSPIFVPEVVLEALSGVTSRLRGENYSEALQEFALQFFFTLNDDPKRKHRILTDLLSFPKSRFMAIWDAISSYDASAATDKCNVPILYIQATSPTDLNRFRESNSHFLTAKTVGSGHYHQLEVPEQVNWMIKRFLELPNPTK